MGTPTNVTLRPASCTAVALVLASLTLGCGSSEPSDASPPGGVECGEVDPLGAGFLAERELMQLGRSDAGFFWLTGDASGAVFEHADELRGQMMLELAAEAGAEVPAAAEPPDGCTVPGIEVQGFSRTALTAIGWATGFLKDAVQAAPIGGETRFGPKTQNDTYSGPAGEPNQMSITMSTLTRGHDSTVEVTTTASSTIVAGSVTIVETATITATMDVCPDAGGLAKGTLVATFDGGATDGSTFRGVVSDEFYVVVDDSAHATFTNHVYSCEYHATGAAAANMALHGVATHAPSGLEGSVTVDAAEGSEASQRFVNRNLPMLALPPAIVVLSEAESKWRDGTCVEVRSEPTSAGGGSIEVTPGEAVSVTATPFQKFEMAEFDAPVVATLSGKASVDPANEAVASPATFEYVGGDECKDEGTVNLRSTSKRGIGRGSVSFQTKADPDMECPEGQRVNTDTCLCECTERESCRSGQTWDEASCQCVCTPPAPCGNGQTWDPASCACVCDRECPAGETLNRAQCRCETVCELNAAGQVPPDCKWTGSIQISSSESGEYSPFEDETITWEHEYEGSFQLEDEDGYLSVSGPVNASYLQVTTYEAPANGCSSTVTLDESISDDLDHAGFVRILTSANGSALLSVNMDGDVPVGTETTEYQGADCPDTRTTDSEGIGAPPLDVMISVTGSSASGSSDDATELTGVTTTFPDDSGARFALSWNLQLVRR